ncbi:unnamed protein product [Peronospora destructor]|uniref:Uncharacterized protein n=1 Tax=Peronospora destructor TaxID=86335 RepID=A0AAV0U109_9STRA|nr:unnamed protein product [Peronospora destructor]
MVIVSLSSTMSKIMSPIVIVAASFNEPAFVTLLELELFESIEHGIVVWSALRLSRCVPIAASELDTMMTSIMQPKKVESMENLN